MKTKAQERAEIEAALAQYAGDVKHLPSLDPQGKLLGTHVSFKGARDAPNAKATLTAKLGEVAVTAALEHGRADLYARTVRAATGATMQRRQYRKRKIDIAKALRMRRLTTL